MLKWMVKGDTLSGYLQACKNADLSNFKQDQRLRKIFEHTSVELAWSYYNQTKQQNPWLLDKKYSNDEQGGAELHLFGKLFVSCATMQYIGVMSNIFRLCGSLNNLRICEIGGGYGGQCRTIMDVFRPACYHIIDLPEVGHLQRRYCNANTFTAPTGQEYDLCISNYALSEIVNNKSYIDDVCRLSKAGYITCNTDMVKLDWPHKRLPDIEGERETNYILIW